MLVFIYSPFSPWGPHLKGSLAHAAKGFHGPLTQRFHLPRAPPKDSVNKYNQQPKGSESHAAKGFHGSRRQRVLWFPPPKDSMVPAAKWFHGSHCQMVPLHWVEGQGQSMTRSSFSFRMKMQSVFLCYCFFHKNYNNFFFISL